MDASVFSHSLFATLLAISEILVVALAAGILVRLGAVTQTQIKALSTVTLNVFLPCLIISKIVISFRPGEIVGWWLIPLAAMGMAFVGLGIGALCFIRELPAKRNMLPLTSIHNAGYLVLPIGLALFPADFDRFALYCFLFIMGHSPVLWSVGKALCTAGEPGKAWWREFVSPPFLSNIIALLLVFSGAHQLLPTPLLRATDLMGDAAVPLATFILGAVLGGQRVLIRPYWKDSARIITVKLMIMPILTMLTLSWIGLHSVNPLLARFFVIQAAAAPAVAIILLVKSYGGDDQKVSSIMVQSYFACAFTLPLWVSLWATLNP